MNAAFQKQQESFMAFMAEQEKQRLDRDAKERDDRAKADAERDTKLMLLMKTLFCGTCNLNSSPAA